MGKENLSPWVTERLRRRFRAKVYKRPDGCWQWTGNINAEGYGTLYEYGQRLAHRVALELEGIDVTGKEVHHKCRLPLCVRPDHLLAVTSTEHFSHHRRKPRY